MRLRELDPVRIVVLLPLTLDLDPSSGGSILSRCSVRVPLGLARHLAMLVLQLLLELENASVRLLQFREDRVVRPFRVARRGRSRRMTGRRIVDARCIGQVHDRLSL